MLQPAALWGPRGIGNGSGLEAAFRANTSASFGPTLQANRVPGRNGKNKIERAGTGVRGVQGLV